MTRGLRLVFLLVALTCALSAAGFLLLRHGLEPAQGLAAEFSAYNHPAEPWFLDAHVVSAVALTLVLGIALGVHVLPSLATESRARRSGLGLAIWAAVMVASGALLPVIAAEGPRLALVWIHGLSGACFALWIPVHLACVRRSRRARNGQGVSTPIGGRPPRTPRAKPRSLVGARPPYL